MYRRVVKLLSPRKYFILFAALQLLYLRSACYLTILYSFLQWLYIYIHIRIHVIPYEYYYISHTNVPRRLSPYKYIHIHRYVHSILTLSVYNILPIGSAEQRNANMSYIRVDYFIGE